MKMVAGMMANIRMTSLMVKENTNGRMVSGMTGSGSAESLMDKA